MKYLFIVLLSLQCLALTAQVKYENELFSIYFPDKVVEEKHKIKMPSGKKITLKVLASFDKTGCTYIVNYYEYPEDLSGYDPLSILKSTAEGFAEESFIELTEEITKIRHKGLQGMEFSGFSEGQNQYYNYRIFLIQKHIVQIAAIKEGEFLNKKLAQNFFKGFKGKD